LRNGQTDKHGPTTTPAQPEISRPGSMCYWRYEKGLGWASGAGPEQARRRQMPAKKRDRGRKWHAGKNQTSRPGSCFATAGPSSGPPYNFTQKKQRLGPSA